MKCPFKTLHRDHGHQMTAPDTKREEDTIAITFNELLQLLISNSAFSNWKYMVAVREMLKMSPRLSTKVRLNQSRSEKETIQLQNHAS